MKKVIEVSTKTYVKDGPHLYVSQLLYKMGPMSTKKIYAEYLKDNAVDEMNFIHSRNHLKNKILGLMLV